MNFVLDKSLRSWSPKKKRDEEFQQMAPWCSLTEILGYELSTGPRRETAEKYNHRSAREPPKYIHATLTRTQRSRSSTSRRLYTDDPTPRPTHGTNLTKLIGKRCLFVTRPRKRDGHFFFIEDRTCRIPVIHLSRANFSNRPRDSFAVI